MQGITDTGYVLSAYAKESISEEAVKVLKANTVVQLHFAWGQKRTTNTGLPPLNLYQC